jgi:hypothetical protein
MVNRVDGAVRTRAEKPATAARVDGRMRTLAQKTPVVGGFPHTQAVII